MDAESASIKQRRYDLSMSKRTRKANMARVISQENEEEVKDLSFTPLILSQQNKEEAKEFIITPVVLSQENEEEAKEFKTTPVILSQQNEEEAKEFKITPVVLSQQNEEEAKEFKTTPVILSQQNEEEAKEFKTTPVILSQQNEEEAKEFKCVIKEDLVNEKVFIPVPPTPSRPSLKELIQVTNKEEKDAKEVSKEDLVSEKVVEKEKEKKFLPLVVAKKGQIVNGGKPAGIIRRYAKVLNQIIKVRHGQKQKNIVPLLAQ